MVDDFNEDGNLDILAGENGRAQILYGDGSAAFTSSTVSYQFSGTTSELGNRHATALDDFNKDGNLDRIAIYDQEPNCLAGISFGNGSIISSPTSFVNLTNGSGINRELLVYDFNGDGSVDILAQSRPLIPGDVGYLFLSSVNGNGTFKSLVTIGLSSHLDYGLKLGDINGDKVLDVVTSIGAMVAESTPNTNPKSTTVGYLNLLSQNNSREALTTALKILKNLSAEVSAIGAAESRLNVAVGNLQTSIIKETDARSRILDADIAKEASDLIRRGIVQQAAVAVLSQANIQPQVALGLI